MGALYDRFLRKSPKQSRSRSVVESVLQAAMELVSEKDEDDETALHEIASRAGVGVGSLYDYFADRGSILSGVAAKVTEDNLRFFEAQLETSRREPLDVAVGQLIDLMFRTYLSNVRIPRIALKVAHRIGLMPTIADSLRSFSVSLSRALKQRDDVRPEDVDVAAFVVTNMAMGVLHTLMWSENRAFTDAQLRDQLVEACVRYLRVDAQPG